MRGAIRTELLFRFDRLPARYAMIETLLFHELLAGDDLP